MSDSLFVRFISILSSKIGRVLLGVISIPIIVRILGSSSYGDYAFLMSMVSILLIVTNKGIYAGVRKFVSESTEIENWESYVIGYYTKLTILIIIPFLSVLVGIYLVNDIILSQRYYLVGYFVVISLVLLTRHVFLTLRSALMGLGSERYSEPLSVLEKAVFVIIGIPLAYFGSDLNGLFIGQVLGAIISSVIALYILKYIHKISFNLSGFPSNYSKVALLRYGFLNMIFILLINSMYHADILILQPITGSTETGLYRAALDLAHFVWFVPIAVQTLLLHSSSSLWSQNKLEEVSQIASQSTRLNLVFTSIVVIGLFTLAHDFVPFYLGTEFGSSTIPLLLLLPGVFGFSIARPIFAIGQGKGDLKQLIRVTLVAAILNVILNIILIPMFGMYGAAVATSISYSSMFFLHLWCARQIGFNPLHGIDISRFLILFVSSFIIVFLSGRIITSSLFSLLLVPVIGFSFHIFISIKLNLVNESELLELTSKLPPYLRTPANNILYRI